MRTPQEVRAALDAAGESKRALDEEINKICDELREARLAAYANLTCPLRSVDGFPGKDCWMPLDDVPGAELRCSYCGSVTVTAFEAHLDKVIGDPDPKVRVSSASDGKYYLSPGSGKFYANHDPDRRLVDKVVAALAASRRKCGP